MKNTVRKKLVPFIFLVKKYANTKAITLTDIIEIIVNNPVNPNEYKKFCPAENAVL